MTPTMKISKHNYPLLVEVEWKDCCYSDEFNAEPGLIVLFTVGYVIEDTEEYLALAKEQHAVDKSYRHITSIPKVGIVKVKQLRYK